MSARLRAATLADVQTLEYWDTLPHVAAAGGEDDAFDWPAEIARNAPWQEILIAEANGRPAGVLQIIDPAREITGYWGETGPGFRAIDIWIFPPELLGQGISAKMMLLALTRCFAAPETHTVLVDPLASNLPAHRFYERLRFVCEGARQFGADACLVYALSREQYVRTA